MDDDEASGVQISIRFLNSLMHGFPLFVRQDGLPQYMKFHQSSLRYSGMDGLLACKNPTETLEFIRCQIFEGSFAGWVTQSDPSGSIYIGYSLITNVRPFCHQSGYWNTNNPVANSYVACCQAITHGSGKETEHVFMYNNTSIGSHNHIDAGVLKNGGSGTTNDGAGAQLFPWRGQSRLRTAMGRNNILAVRPNGSRGETFDTAIGSGDSHVSIVFHANHIGWNTTGVTYSFDYNLYHRGAGMPTVGQSGVITTIDSGGTERARNSITDVRNDTGQEQNGGIADPQFIGTWDAGELDRVLHTNAQWCIPPTSPAASGGDTTDRTWPDMDFGVQVNYGGNTWRGCMDPAASAVEQQVGPLGPLPSGL
jgi:hypothetical protein